MPATTATADAIARRTLCRGRDKRPAPRSWGEPSDPLGPSAEDDVISLMVWLLFMLRTLCPSLRPGIGRWTAAHVGFLPMVRAFTRGRPRYESTAGSRIRRPVLGTQDCCL